jgi:hypothetical protein
MNKITLRPSSIRSFHETPAKWYKNHVLNEDKFEGNTATYLGTIIHKYAETYYTLGDFNPHEILEDAPEDVDKTQILAEYEDMCKALDELYLSKHSKPELIERFMRLSINDEIELQGTCDFYDNGVLGDYKTSSKPQKDISPYSQQLNIYAFLLSTIGKEVHTLRVVNIIRKTKTIKPRVHVLECKADIQEGKRLVNLMANKTQLALNNPDKLELIFTENNYSFLSDGFKIETNFIELKE